MHRFTLMAAWCALFVAAQSWGADKFELPSPKLRWQDLPDTDTTFQLRAFAGRAEWETRRGWLIEQIRFAAGLWPEPTRTPLRPQEFDTTERPDYTISKVYFESQPGFYVTGNLFRPRNIAGKVPAVLVAHGHAEHGRLHHDERSSVFSACITLARMGIIAFAYDMLGYTDAALQTPHIVDTPQRSLWGIGSFGLQTWNSIRAVDYLQSLPEVDRNRIGMTGASGGGTQTFILSAIDDRVIAAAPVCMVSAHMQGGCQCENAPSLRIDANNVEITSCIAPRPLLLVSATGDWTDKTPQVEYPAIRAIYEFYGAVEKVNNAHFDAEHNFNNPSRVAVERFMARYLLNRTLPNTFKENAFVVESEKRLRVFAPDWAKGSPQAKAEKLIGQMIDAQKGRLDSLSPASAGDVLFLSNMFRDGMKHAVATEFPQADEIIVGPRTEAPTFGNGWLGEQALLKNQAFLDKAGFLPFPQERFYVRNQRAVRTFEMLTTVSPREPGGITLCVHPDGVAIAERMELFVLACMSQAKPDRVIFVEPFGTGEMRLPTQTTQPVADADSPSLTAVFQSPVTLVGKARGTSKFFSTFNRTDLAETVYDLVTVIAAQFKIPATVPKINLIGFAEMGPAMLLARTLIPAQISDNITVTTVVDMQQMDVSSDEAYLKQVYLPNIRRMGGLAFAAGAATSGPLWLYNVGPSFPRSWLENVGRTRGLPLRITDDDAQLESIAHWAAAQKWVRLPTQSNPRSGSSKAER